MYKLTGERQLRMQREDDQVFLDALYASRRQDLQQLPMDAVVVAQMIKMQQHLQMVGMRQHYPEAQHYIVELAGKSVGRVIIDAGANDLHLVDIAIAPEVQRNGIARSVLLAMQEQALEKNLGISLAVELRNPGARALYLQMGFLVQSSDGLFEQMRWPGGVGIGAATGRQMEQPDVAA
ncbi:GNAT family N-acetyltransferase [Undibacterium sp. Di26W]|uniref:GNAT family N-acetyltransferase n=1 Tax=Undibacterium sp. Di26W TaxID=3413035 RepID=UPI003BF27117